jgi:acyl dehydratase
VNLAAEGIEYPERRFRVDPDRVAAFRAVFGDSDGVPPTFLTVAEFSVFPEIVGDPRVGLDLIRVIHGSQEYELRRPLREGEELTVRTRIASVRKKGPNGFLTIVTDLVDGAGGVIAVGTSTIVERSS